MDDCVLERCGERTANFSRASQVAPVADRGWRMGRGLPDDEEAELSMDERRDGEWESVSEDDEGEL